MATADLLRSDVDPRVVVDPAAVAKAVETIFPEALGVWIYGSTAERSALKESDLDVAILAPRRIVKDWDYLDRVGELGAAVRRNVDLVDLRAVPPALRFEIFSNGLRIAARDPIACDRYETTAVSAFQRLNFERREIFDAIRERGTVY
ncbi:MAG: nucleotidyltransferase domain-containing protein [Geminicoccaceae bacterium]